MDPKKKCLATCHGKLTDQFSSDERQKQKKL